MNSTGQQQRQQQQQQHQEQLQVLLVGKRQVTRPFATALLRLEEEPSANDNNAIDRVDAFAVAALKRQIARQATVAGIQVHMQDDETPAASSMSSRANSNNTDISNKQYDQYDQIVWITTDACTTHHNTIKNIKQFTDSLPRDVIPEQKVSIVNVMRRNDDDNNNQQLLCHHQQQHQHIPIFYCDKDRPTSLQSAAKLVKQRGWIAQRMRYPFATPSAVLISTTT